MSVAGLNWKLNGPKLESVSLNVSYTANNDFTIGDYGHPLYGSVWVSLEKFTQVTGHTISSTKASLGVCSLKGGNLEYPKTLLKKGSGNFTLKCLPPSATLEGLLKIMEVWEESWDISKQGKTQLVCRGCNFQFPSLRVGLSFYTPAGVKGDYKDYEIKDAFLVKKTLKFWMDDIGTTGYS